MRKTIARVQTTDAEIDAAITRANVAERERPKAIAAVYRSANDTVVTTLATGVQVAIPRKLLQGLQDATPRQLAKVEIEGPGTGLHWPLLDVDHYIPAVLAGVGTTVDPSLNDTGVSVIPGFEVS